jgi:hypothetical protein
MTTLLIVFASILSVFALYSVLAPLALNIGRFRGGFRLNCPNGGRSADVKLHAGRAALSTAYGDPQLRMRRCSLQRPGEWCDEACLKGVAL